MQHYNALMKAILCRKLGPPETLTFEDISPPNMGPADVRINVHAAGVNFPDLLIIEGKYQFRPEMPFSPGAEVSGDVLETGSQVTRVRKGDRVIGISRWNGFAEEVVVPEERCLQMPPNMTYQVGAGFPMTYGTSYHALVQRGQLRPGETLLVHGASGGVGTAALDIGRNLGASLIATGGDDKKLQVVATKYGLRHTVNYHTNPLWKDEVKALTGGRGADVIYDPVGGSVLEQSLRCINWNGRVLVVGFASGSIPKIPANLVLLKGCQVVGVFWGAFLTRTPSDNLQNFQTLFDWFEADRLNPIVSKTLPLSRACDALDLLRDRTIVGKVVLTMR